MTIKIHCNTFPAAKIRTMVEAKLLSLLIPADKTRKPYEYQTKTERAKSQFNIAHCSVQSKTKQLTDVNNIEIRQLIN